jgi:hypothetical protein
VRSGRIALETLQWPAGGYAPGGPLGKGKSIGDVRAVACVDCGSVQWAATNVRRLAEIYEEQQSESLHLSEPESRQTHTG